MNHCDALTLRAFLAALADADPLSPDLKAKIHAIGQDLEHRANELDQIVEDCDNEPLKVAYQRAGIWLSCQAAERKAGWDDLPENTRQQQDLHNIAEDIESTPTKDKSTLENRSQGLANTPLENLISRARIVLGADDPVEQFYITFPGLY